MPATTVTVARPKTKLIWARDAPRSASTGVRKTLKAYSVPNGRLTAVAARSAAALLCPGLNGVYGGLLGILPASLLPRLRDTRNVAPLDRKILGEMVLVQLPRVALERGMETPQALF